MDAPQQSSTGSAGVAAWPLLGLLGFVPDASVISDGGVGFILRCRGLEVHASQSVSKYLKPIILVLGYWRSESRLCEVHLELLPTVDSLDQLKALLAFGIGHECPAAAELPWLVQGHEWKALLPWEQERALYARRRAARPHCFVGRPWMRLLLSEVRGALDAVAEDSPVGIDFDGALLSFVGVNFSAAAPARGPARWPAPHLISARTLRGLPKRLMSDPVEVGLWEGQLEVGRLTLTQRSRGTGVGASASEEVTAEVLTIEERRAAVRQAVERRVREATPAEQERLEQLRRAKGR